MSVIGICQCCGFIAPMESFLAETEHRQLSAVLIELPKDVQGVAFHYLSLFRPSKSKAVQVKKAVRLMGELRDLVKTGHVQVKGRVARPCPPRIWVQAIEKMIEQRDRLNLPMPNHNYLLQVAWDLADSADAQGEKQQYATVRQHRQQPDRAAADPSLDPLEKARREWDEKHGAPTDTIRLNSISDIVKGVK